MAWKSYALGKVTLATAITSAATILAELFDDCVANTDAGNLTLTVDGNSYTTKAASSSATASYDTGLFVNDATGAFLISAMKTAYPNTTGKTYENIMSSLLEIQTGDEQTTLVPIANYNVNYGTAFSIPYSASSSGSNNTNFVTLVPLVTQMNYNANVANSLYRPVVGLFASNVGNIAVGTTIEVDGQRFLHVATALFAKL